MAFSLTSFCSHSNSPFSVRLSLASPWQTAPPPLTHILDIPFPCFTFYVASYILSMVLGFHLFACFVGLVFFYFLFFGLYVASCNQNTSSKRGDRFSAVWWEHYHLKTMPGTNQALGRYSANKMSAEMVGPLISDLEKVEGAGSCLNLNWVFH